MSEKTPAGVIADELDQALHSLNEAEARASEIRRDLHAATDRVSRFADTAQRLRLALFILEGEGRKTASDANSANAKRQAELRSGR